MSLPTPQRQWDEPTAGIGSVSRLAAFKRADGMWIFVPASWADVQSGSVVAEPFGTGDGLRTLFPLVRHVGAIADNVTPTGTPTLFRSDWQGNQRLYPTARTNLVAISEPTYAQCPTRGGGTDTVNPAATWGGLFANGVNFAGANGVTKFAYSSLSGYAGQPQVFSIYVRMGDGSAPRVGSSTSTSADFALVIGGNTAQSVTITQVPGTSIYRVAGFHAAPSTSTYGAVQYNTQTTAKAFDWTGRQLELGAAATSYLKTATAAVTLTDYVLTPTGLAVLAVPPLAGAALTWSGSWAMALSAGAVVPPAGGATYSTLSTLTTTGRRLSRNLRGTLFLT